MSNRDDESKSRKRDPDIANVEAALRRAALRAREDARRAGLKIPVYRDGQIVEEWPAEQGALNMRQSRVVAQKVEKAKRQKQREEAFRKLTERRALRKPATDEEIRAAREEGRP